MIKYLKIQLNARLAKMEERGALSNVPESEQSASTMGNSFSMSLPNRLLCKTPWRARIQFLLPLRVLISPLWLMNRFG
jgi:hypothetical protein